MVLCFLVSLLILYLISKLKIGYAFLHNRPFYLQFLLFSFLFIITSYWTNHYFEYYTTPASLENRKLTKQPKFDTIKYAPDYFFSTFTSWFTDYFPFRQRLVHYNSLIRTGILGVSPIPSEVIIGKDFQFFPANELVQEDFVGRKIFTNEELNALLSCIEGKKKYMADRHMDFYFTIPPSKQTVYHDFMPDYYRVQEGDNKLAQQLKKKLEQAGINYYINIIDTLYDYYKLHPEKKVFYQYDIHWSEWGAFKAYQVLMNRIYKDHPEFGLPLKENEIRIDTVYDDKADLAKLIVMNQILKRERYIITPLQKDSIKEIRSGLKTPVCIDYNPKGKGRILIFRDSYSEEWKNLIVHHFNESIFIWDPKMSTAQIEKYKPDIVLQENGEENGKSNYAYLFYPLINGDNEKDN